MSTTEEALIDGEARAQSLYDNRLRTILEPERDGEAVAIHPESGDYEVAPNWALARRALRARQPNGFIYSQFIGPVSLAEWTLAQHVEGGGGKR